jgi:hypothetical protein
MDDLNKGERTHDNEALKKLPPQQPNRDIIVAKEIHFLLCESCFWCASCLNVAKRTVTKCPSCSDARLESMPISDSEIYKFEYDPERGETLEFSFNKRLRPK